MELAQHADTLERCLQGERLDGYEILVSHSRELTIEVKEGQVDAFKCADPFGVAVRVQCGEGLGFSFSTALDPQSLSRMVEGALVAARMQSPDPCHGLPKPAARYPELSDLLDDSLAVIPEQQKIECALELEQLVLASDPRLKRVRKCSYNESRHGVLIRNSQGLDAGYRASAVSCSVSAVAEAQGDAQMGWDFGFSPRFTGLDLQRIADGASRKATSLLGARSLATMRCQAVFDNRTAASLLEVLSSSFLAENVHKGKSLFAGRVGERIFSPLVTVRDNGLLADGMDTAPCDGEGVPQQDTLLVSDGSLEGFLYDTFWGAKMGVRSTGNAVRGGVMLPPKMGVHNLHLAPGEHTLAQLISGVGKGVLITEVMGIHSANRISGDFSVGAAGFYLENGEIRYPVKGIAIAGNLLELFGRVDLVADDLRFFGSTGSPSLRVSELDVSGS